MLPDAYPASLDEWGSRVGHHLLQLQTTEPLCIAMAYTHCVTNGDYCWASLDGVDDAGIMASLDLASLFIITDGTDTVIR